MHRYRVTIVAELTAPLPSSARRHLDLAGTQVTGVGGTVVRFRRSQFGRCPQAAADLAVQLIALRLPPEVSFSRPPVWTARRTGAFALRRAVTGRGAPAGGGGPGDGPAGVREPRRPLRPSGAGSIALRIDTGP